MADWSPLREALTHVETSVQFGWEELDALVGGLPKSAYVHNAFWKGVRSGWPGFTTTDVQVGESVTFVRVGPATTPPRPTDMAVGRAAPSAADVVLVGCVKAKRHAPALARDLYVSALFQKERRYAERSGVPWFILSAEHGLVSPDEILEPYDLRLSATTRHYRRAWGERVINRLIAEVGEIRGRTVEIHAGSAYSDSIRDGLERVGAIVIEPLSGLTMGHRLAWYNESMMAASGRSADVSELLQQLTDANRAITPAEFLATGAARYASPGLYSWWVDEEGAVDLAAGLGHQVQEGLIYAGLAGATRSSGRKSKNTLWGRIKTMHLGGRHEFSTFRLSLGSVLASATGASDIDEASLTDWMHAHLRLIPIPVSDADSLGAVETDLLAELDPPLNLDKVVKNSLRRRLSELRKQYSRKRRRSLLAQDQ